MTTRIDRDHTAVLVMDYQAGILARVGDAAGPLLDRAASVLSAARAAKMPVIYVVVGFRPGHPEINPNNAMFGHIAKNNLMVTETPGSDIDPKVKPAAGDVIIFKHRVGAFSATDLDLILRAKAIDTLILLGISTSGVILSTTRHAADVDYKLLIAKDGCADADEEVHRVLMDKVLARQATVLSCADVIAALS